MNTHALETSRCSSWFCLTALAVAVIFNGLTLPAFACPGGDCGDCANDSQQSAVAPAAKRTTLSAKTAAVKPKLAAGEADATASAPTPAPSALTPLPPLEITGGRPYEPLADALTTPANDEPFTARLERAEIDRRRPVNAAEALRYTTPNLIWTRQNRKYRNFYDFRGEKVSLALDGTPVQDGSTNGSMRGDDRILDLMGTDQIEAIEVIKDSSAMIYGTLRGGLIHVRTRKPGPGKHSWASLAYGTYGSKDLKLNLSDRLDERTAWLAAFSAYGYDGPIGKNAQEYRQTVDLKWFRDFSSRDQLELTYRRQVGEFGIPVDENANGKVPQRFFDLTTSLVTVPENGWDYGPWSNTLFDLKLKHKWNDRQSTDFQWSRLDVENDFHNPRGVTQIISGALVTAIGHISPHHVTENTTSYAIRHTSKWHNDAITRIGYLYDHWHNPTGKLYWENKDNEDEKHSYYVQGEIPFAQKWVFDAGFRRDRRYIIREEKSRVPTGKVQSVINNQWEDARDNSSFGLTFKPTRNDTLALRAGSVEVSPVDRYATINGAPLQDEKDKLLNAAYEHRFDHLRNTSIAINVFSNELQNALIDDPLNVRYTDAASTTWMRIFVNRTTKVTGSEITLKSELGKHFDGRIGVGQLKYDPDVPGKPRINYNFSLLYHGPRDLEAELYGVYVGKWQSSTSVVTGKTLTGGNVTKVFPYELGDYTDLNLTVRKALPARHGLKQNVTLAARNLLDKRFETMVFTPVYGRTFTLTYDFEF